MSGHGCDPVNFIFENERQAGFDLWALGSSAVQSRQLANCFAVHEDLKAFVPKGKSLQYHFIKKILLQKKVN